MNVTVLGEPGSGNFGHERFGKRVLNALVTALGGKGSGHFGHDGRPGYQGGSEPGDGDGAGNDGSFKTTTKTQIEKWKDAPVGTIVAKAPKGYVDVHSNDGYRPFAARTKNGELLGTYNTIENAKQAVHDQARLKNPENFSSGWRNPLPEPVWKDFEPSSTRHAEDMNFRYLEVFRTAGAARKITYNGREHYVVPVVALMEGVIHAVNAKDAEFVPYETISSNVAQWNGRPLMLGHPVRDGVHIAASDPTVLESGCFGSVFNARLDDRRLLMDAYVDPDRLIALGREDVLNRVIEGTPIEISVGAQVATKVGDGDYKGKSYKAKWIAMSADHLAMLPDGRGACSIAMGCGAHRAMAEYEQEDDMTEETLGKRMLTAIMTALGKAEPVPAKKRELAKYKDCPMCQGSGSKDGNPCDACEGSGELRTASGSGEDSNEQGDTDMSKKALIDKLTACECSGFKPEDATFLEAFPESRLVTMAEGAASKQSEKEAEDEAKRKAQAKMDAEDAAKMKEAADKRSLEQQVADLETKLRTAETKQLTEDEFAARAPESIRALVADKRAADAAETTTLIATLKAASSAFSDEELAAKALGELRKLAALAKVDVPDYSGRGVAQLRTADKNNYAPPNPYDAGIKAMQAKH